MSSHRPHSAPRRTVAFTPRAPRPDPSGSRAEPPTAPVRVPRHASAPGQVPTAVSVSASGLAPRFGPTAPPADQPGPAAPAARTPAPSFRPVRAPRPFLPAGLALGALGAALIGGGTTLAASDTPAMAVATSSALPPATLPTTRSADDVSTAISDVWVTRV